MQLPSNCPPHPLDYAVPARRDDRWGKGFLAVCGTLLLWGAGHWIAGRWRRGTLWLLASLFLTAALFAGIVKPFLVPALLVLVPLYAVLVVTVLIDAFICGRRSRGRMLGRAALRYLAGVLLVAASYPFGRLIGTAAHSAFRAAGEESFVIPFSSMAPTLLPGDRLLTHRSATVSRWDVVIYHPPVRPAAVFAGRVVGLPGEKVEIAEGQIRINDVPHAPPALVVHYLSILSPGTGCEGHPIVLGPDEYFILGDNSRIAYDGRYWDKAAAGHQLGAVPREAITHRATAIYFPLNRLRWLR